MYLPQYKLCLKNVLEVAVKRENSKWFLSGNTAVMYEIKFLEPGHLHMECEEMHINIGIVGNKYVFPNLITLIL